MNEQREIVKASWLQHVVHKKGGTLHRKKVNFNLMFHSYNITFLEKFIDALIYLSLFVVENSVWRGEMGRTMYPQWSYTTFGMVLFG